MEILMAFLFIKLWTNCSKLAICSQKSKKVCCSSRASEVVLAWKQTVCKFQEGARSRLWFSVPWVSFCYRILPLLLLLLFFQLVRKQDIILCFHNQSFAWDFFDILPVKEDFVKGGKSASSFRYWSPVRCELQDTLKYICKHAVVEKKRNRTRKNIGKNIFCGFVPAREVQLKVSQD